MALLLNAVWLRLQHPLASEHSFEHPALSRPFLWPAGMGVIQGHVEPGMPQGCLDDSMAGLSIWMEPRSRDSDSIHFAIPWLPF